MKISFRFFRRSVMEFVMCKQNDKQVNMPSLQEQLDFMEREYQRSKLVYNFLLREFGWKRIHLLDKEMTGKVMHYKAVIHSLRELQNLK